MRRREAITTGGIVLITGCAGNTPETDADTSESNTTDTDTADTNTTDVQSQPEEEEKTVLTISNVSVSDPVKQGSNIVVSAEINTTTNATVTADLTTVNSSKITSTQTTVTPETKDVTIELSIPNDAIPGEGTARVVVQAGNISDQSTIPVTISEVIPEWKKPFNVATKRVKKYLNDFAAEGSEAEDRTILDTTISSGFGSAGTFVLSEADEAAFNALEEVDGGNQNARGQIQRLRSEISMLRELDNTQESVCELFPQVQDGRITGSYFETVEPVRKKQKQLSKSISNLNPIVGTLYKKKVTQMDEEINAVNNMIAPIEDFRSAQDSYDSQSYGAAANQAQVVQSQIQSVINDINTPTAYPPTDSVDEDFVSAIESWETKALNLQQKAAEKQSESGY
jgi:hypothetical protein